MVLRLRRGTDAERAGIIFAEGELIYVTDTKALYVGDDTTTGGILVTAGSGSPAALTQNLDLNGYNISGSGTVSATTFYGDGSNLTGISSGGGAGVIDGQEYLIDIQGNVRALDSNIIVNAFSGAVTASTLAGDGSGITNISLDQLSTVGIYTASEGEVLTYFGGEWTNRPASGGNGLIEGQEYIIDIVGNVKGIDSTVLINATTKAINAGAIDSTTLYSSSTSTADGGFIGDLTGNVSGSLTGITYGYHYGDVSGSVFSDDSSPIVDAQNRILFPVSITSYNNAVEINPDTDSATNSIVINATDGKGEIQLKRNSTSDLTGITNIPYGTISFSRDDVNGPGAVGFISGYENAILIASNSGGSFGSGLDYLTWKEQKLGVGTVNPAAAVEIVGGSIYFNDTRAYTSVTAAGAGELMFDSNNGYFHYYTGSEWARIPSQLLTNQLMSFDTVIRLAQYSQAVIDAVGSDSTNITGSVLYNSDEDRVQFFQAGSWVSLPNNGTAIGEILKWDGNKWSPGQETGVAPTGSNADFLDGFDSPYFLDYNNFTNTPSIFDGAWSSLTGTPTTLAGYGITDAATSAQGTLADSALQSGDNISELTNNSGYLTTVAFADVTSKPTTLAGYGITDAATSAQGTLADSAVQPADLGNFTFTSSVLDSSDSSGITVTPAVTMSSDLTVENDLVVSNTVTATRFISTSSGTPTMSSDSNLDLEAVDRVRVTASPFRVALFTTAERDALSAVNGDIIYNTTLNKFQGYENGAWANLI